MFKLHNFGGIVLSGALVLTQPAMAGNLTLSAAGLFADEMGVSVTALDDILEKLELAGFVKDAGAANRIVGGDILRALSQEIPAAVCHLHNNVDVEEAAELLEHSIVLFDTVADALLHGNVELGIIGPEERRKTVVELEQLIADWEPVHDAALAVLENPSDAENAAIVYDASEGMYDKTYHLLANLEGEYSNPSEILATDVMLLEVVGRMAAMNQRLAFDACMVWSHAGDGHHNEDLMQTMSIYENSLTALTVGMPALGIAPPPTEEIANKLAHIGDHWSDVHNLLVRIAEGEDVTTEERGYLYHELAVKLHSVEELELLYQNYAKRIY